MTIGLIGKKLGMSQVYSPMGDIIPVTVIQAGPCVVVEKKTAEKDGYTSLQIGFLKTKSAKLSKPLQGYFKNKGMDPVAVLKEFRTDHVDGYDVGAELTVALFDEGEKVNISGISKGKGFAGNIKRWGFHRGPMTHGSKHHRAVGSLGSSAYPSHIFKGRKMPGHLGSEKVTVKNLEVVERRIGENILLVKGAVPGGINSILVISKN